MPPKVTKLTSFLPQQKKTQASDNLKGNLSTKESLKLETPVTLGSTLESTPIKNELPLKLLEKEKVGQQLPEMSLKRARIQFILKTPQKQVISTGRAKTSEVIDKEVKVLENNNSDQKAKEEIKEPIPAYLKYAHLLNKPIHKRYEDESAIDKLAPPKLVDEGSRTCASTLPEKSKLPSFLKYKHLVTLREKKALPRTFESLKRNFNALSNIILFNKSKNQIVIFHKILPSIQMISKQSFNIQNLSQLKYLLGDALVCKGVEFIYKGEKVKSWELNLVNGNNESGENLWTTDKEFGTKQSGGQNLEFLLKDKLYGIVEEAHENFLTSNNLTIENEYEWHPKFNVESLNDTIPTHPDVSEHNSKEEIVKPKIEESSTVFAQLMNVAKSSARKPTDFSTPNSEAKPESSVKDRRAALLEKIKAKQALKEQQQKETSSNGLNSKKLLMIDQLLNLLNSIFLTFQLNGGKPVMLDDIAQKLMSGQNCRLDKFEIIAHLRLLKELVPDFCSIEPLKNSRLGEGYELMKLNIKIDLNKVKFALNSFKQQN
ncbi:hypothetical protein CONCODRAFT_79944 [Conidiobolus coronatus NRRL 28638]|uniref:CDT1 Geminin-binding domain-containing protein n=1 Tax=Conidiobolus coronatus (strain ATCC 28846 / CBS 209.66 / NRRL 28638) TaxID=796925 RepID=A0A137NYV1_CONC2|nr:hypothetical protein CONCODRAFT_79944 [Conidiobolus coronatus NRRL 28638]|eukprot:KXN67995.1 hypothetical protein CONCODRAFT_79944 [Conidiobolus coronatus NRRL 28638]